MIVATRRSIQPIETLVWSWTRSWHGMVVGLRRMSLLGLNRIAYLGVPMGLLLGIQTLRDLWAADNLNPELSPFSSAGYIGAAIAMLTLGASILLTLRSGVWLVGRPSTWARGRPADAIVTGAAVGVGTWPYMGLLLAVSASLSLGLIVRLSGGSNLLSGSRFARALAVGLLGGFASGAITWWLPSVKRGFLDSVALGMLGGVGVAATAALFAGVADGFRQRRVAAVHPAERPAGGLRRLLGIVAIVAAVYGLMLGVAPYTGGLPFIRGITLMSARLGGGWVSGLSLSLMVVTIAGLFGMVTGAFLGALFGLLNGLTGPDIDRRTVPNQGIRQSAANVSVFALAGILIVGLPYGLMNLMIAAAWTRVAPQPLDWVHLTVAPAVLFGLAGGLVPGAACIQHLALRFVLWGCGVAPLRYVRFLNYATERMLLQRVGGRYRFIHDLLREHLAAMHPTSATVRKG